MGVKTWLGLKKRRYASQPMKRWPAELAENHEGPIVTFGIPLKSAKTSTDWGNTQALLGATLRSVIRQSDPRWRVVICGHEVPDIPEIANRRVEFIVSKYPPPSPPRPGEGGRTKADKFRKHVIIGLRIRDFGGGYYMSLDADDLIHRDLVSTALASEHGCVISRGYICDAMTNAVAPLPGALSVDFDRVCGSMAVVRYDVDDLPDKLSKDDMSDSLFAVSLEHGYLRGICDEVGKPLAVVPFPGAMYFINHRDNHSFLSANLGRSNLVSLVRKHAITDLAQLTTIFDDFGWTGS